MHCPLCGSQKGKRSCPALGQTICSRCCGTKRQVSIRCPASCPYLAVSRIHPPAATVRQRERDFRFTLSLVAKLPERALHLMFLFQQVIATSRGSTFTPLTDGDVREAAACLAATLETAARGILFDHQATSIPAQRLVHDLHEALLEVGKADPGPELEREAAMALRRIEEGARSAKNAFGGTEFDYLEFVGRLPSELSGPADGPVTDGLSIQEPEAPRLIIP